MATSKATLTTDLENRLAQVQDALKRSEERFALLVDGVKDHAISTLGPDGTVATWNLGAERLTGYRADEIIGRHVAIFYPPWEVDTGKPDHLLQVAADQGQVEDEGWRVRKDGSRFWANVVVTALRDEHGRVRGYGKIWRDFTERKRVEHALRVSEEHFRTLAANARDRITRFDRDMRCIYMNPAALEALGRRLERVVGKTAAELGLPASAAETWEAEITEVIRSGAPQRFDRQSMDGRWYDVLLVPEPGPQGDLQSILSVARDITEQRRAEETLRESEQRYSALAEASLRIVRETERTAMLDAIARSALELTGARTSVCGHGPVGGRLVVGASSRAPGAPPCLDGSEFAVEKGGVYMDLVAGALDTVRLTDEQLRANPHWWGLPEGHAPLRGLLGVRLTDREEKTSGMILVTNKERGDFTAADEVLLRQLATLASLASQHVEARASLEQADRSKNQFLAMLSHELRNPLAPILNSLYILEHAAPGSEQARRAQAIVHRQTAHLSRLVDDLLDVTRIARNKIQLDCQLVDLDEALARIVEDNRSLFGERGIDLETRLGTERACVNADGTRLAQIIGNLLHNAAKFTARAGQTTVSLSVDSTNRQAVIRVADTGVGMPPDMLGRLFEPFVQAEETLDRSKGGLGLGLALVKGLVELHGGSIEATSAGLGKGSELTVRLPLALDPIAAVPADQPSAPRAGRRVLIIEDNVDAADTLSEALEFGEHDVAVTYDGPGGIAKARDFRPDVVLCDIGLPGMDGFEVARVLRQEPANDGVLLVALSGYALPEDLRRAAEAGFDAHLAKPASIEQVERLLVGAPGGRPAAG